MFGIPEWSIGVGVIVLCVAAGQILVRLFLPEGARRSLKSPAVDPADVQLRLAELDQLKRRIGELEERVDFAERLLAQQREGQRLGPPHE